MPISVCGRHWQGMSSREAWWRRFSSGSLSFTDNGARSGGFPDSEDLGSCSIHPHGAAFPCSLHPSLTHEHCRAAGVQPIRGFICLFITEFVFISEVGIPSPYKQWTLWSRRLVITFSATCQTGPLRNVCKEGTCLSALLRQGGQASWGNVPAQYFCTLAFLLRASGSGMDQGHMSSIFPRTEKRKPPLLNKEVGGGECISISKTTTHISARWQKRGELLTRLSVQLTTQPWPGRLFLVFLWFILT